jgi:hypothetical protein
MRFVVTHVNKDGVRCCTFGNQGRNHCDTREEAETKLKLFEPSLRAKVLGERADTLKVLEVECYDHGDSVASVFLVMDKDEAPLCEGS